MKKLETFYQLLEVLSYGKHHAKTAEQLAVYFDIKKVQNFKRKLRVLAHDARLNGHWVIGDDSGYYIAVNKEEWRRYRNRRFAAIREELEAMANCDKLSLSDLIKNVYAVTVEDENYNLF